MYPYINNTKANYTMEPPSKGHYGTSHFVPCRETVLFSEVENVLHKIISVHFWDIGNVLCREVVPFSESTLLFHCSVHFNMINEIILQCNNYVFS